MRADAGPRSDLEWMALRASVMLEHDEQGRILGHRDPSSREAPRFYLGRSRHGNLWRFASTLSDALIRDLARLAGREGPLPIDHALPERLQAFRDVLEREAPSEVIHCGPGYRFPAERLRDDTPLDHDVIEIGPANEHRLVDAFPDFRGKVKHWLPAFVCTDGEGRALSACFSARWYEGVGAEAGVETLPGSRGRGAAGRATAAWARAIAKRGMHPFYSTEWENTASQRVAAKLGLVFVGEDLHLS